MEKVGLDWLREYPALSVGLQIALVILLATFSYAIARRIIVVVIRRVASRSQTMWDDALVNARVFARLAHLAPALVVYYGVGFVPELPESLVLLVQRIAVCTIIITATVSAISALSALNEVYSANPESRTRPIKGYLQVVSIALYLVAGLLVIATLMDRSPALFLSGIGAMTAVLLLVFRDTILSLVASVQLTGNDMIHVGDWIEMPQYGADGDVIDVALHTVKVQNWDKTITTIPTHKLISDAFKNWRGMSNSGGRRIKRSLHIDVNTIRFLDEEEIDRFSRFALLRDYIAAKLVELNESNAGFELDATVGADRRRLTNVGTFRAYVLAYLRAHPKIHKGMTLIVRQLQPSPEGLPIEIYAFSNDTDWSAYEDIQSDIFDHILAVIPEFGLGVFQQPAGSDLAKMRKSGTADA